MELRHRVIAQAARRTVYRVPRVPAERITISERHTAGRLRPLAREGLRRRRVEVARDDRPRRPRDAAGGRPLPPAEAAAGARRRWPRSATTALRARSTVDAIGRWKFEIEAWVDHHAGWLDEHDRKVAAGPGGPERRARRGRRAVRAGDRRRVAALGRRQLGDRERHGAAQEHRVRGRRRAGARARRAPGTSCSRARGAAWRASRAVVPELAELGFDVVYLPRSTRSAGRTARGATTPSGPRPATSGARGRSAPRRAGHEAIAPGARHARPTSRRSSRRSGSQGMELALDLALQMLARPPVARGASGVVPAPARTARSSTRRTRPSATRTSTTSTGRRDDRKGLWKAIRDVVLGWCDAGVTGVPRRQPAHEAGPVLGMADRGGAQARTRRPSSCPRPSRARR